MAECDSIRLNKYLAECGLGSRRDCDKIIALGGISINGHPAELGERVDPLKDSVMHNETLLTRERAKEYYAYHKERGSIVTARDTHGRETIYEALAKSGLDGIHLKYVGRLDLDSEGLLLLTNDGDLVHAITHPRFHIKKVYHVKVQKALSEESMSRMINEGIMSDGDLLHAGAIRFKEMVKGEYWYEVDLYEGKNRQVRRLFAGVGHTVIRLKRVQFANITLRDLPLGSYRQLQEREVKGLLTKGYSVNKKKK